MRKKEKKQRLSMLAKFMVLLMIINLFSAISPMVAKADEPDDAHWKPGSVTEGDFTIEKEVTDYKSDDDTYGIKLTVKISEQTQVQGLLIDGGIITDNMSDFVDFVENSVQNVTDGGVPQISFDNNAKVLKVRNVSLAKGQKLEVTYRIKLKEVMKDGEFRETNGETKLWIPDNGNGRIMNFEIPEIKQLVTKKITVRKNWVDTEEASKTDVNFKVWGNTIPLYTGIINKGQQETTFDVPKYANGDEIPNYDVREIDIQNGNTPINEGEEIILGDSKFEVHYSNANEPDTYIITNKLIDNKIKINITKKWAPGVPEIAKKSVKVMIIEAGLKVEPKEVTITAATNWSVTVEVPKYNDGNDLSYSVLETEINGEQINIPFPINQDPSGNGYYYHKAFKITLKDFIDITEDREVVITNGTKTPEFDNNDRLIKVVKNWGETAESLKATVKVRLYKLNGAGKLEEVILVGDDKPLEVELTKDNDWMNQFKVTSVPGPDVYYVLETKVGGTDIDNAKLDELVSSPALINDGYKIGDYQVKINKLSHVNGNYGFYILNEGKKTNNNGGGPVIPGPGTTPGTTPGTDTATDSAINVSTDSTPKGDTGNKADNSDKNTDDNTDDTGIIDDIEDDDVPEGDVTDEEKDEDLDVTDDTAPKGTSNLPRTGGVPAEVFGLLGLGVIGLGLVIKRRK